MAFDNNQQESSQPLGSNSNRRTATDFLPKYFRTPTNQKFLSATIDQMINEGEVEKINAFIGRKDTPAFVSTDRYVEDVLETREAYQFEPALVSRDDLGNVKFFKDYNDYINQLKIFTNKEVNHSEANAEEFYAWNPHIDWDKFVNYREYYWLPTGPQSVAVLGQTTEITSTYTVVQQEEVDNIAYVFSPDGLTKNPNFKLYRGQTYRFEIDCPDRPFAFKTIRTPGAANVYTSGIRVTDENNIELPNDQYIRKGTIEFVVPQNAPNILYYVSENDIDSSGYFSIFDIDESTQIDVDNEIIGKKTYTANGVTKLSNGMKLNFRGQVTPEKYSQGNWYVDGVGIAIRLISEQELETPAQYTSLLEIEFDNENFDSQGYDVNNNFPKTKDYITINRSSLDRNPWSRHNRWFHKDIIEAAAIINNQPVDLDQDARAKRPIIEFEPNIQLWNFGRISKQNVTLVDTFTADVFSTIEGSFGYNIDNVNLVDGMRVLFTADTDVRVNGRIFKVSFISHQGERRLTLIAEQDTDPQEGETVLVTDGVINRGTMYYYADGQWRKAQEKTAVNQSPLFQVVDPQGTSYGDTVKYPGTTFNGCKIFTYAEGTTYDTELGFNISYRNVGNFGDIVFNFNLHTDTHTYQNGANNLVTIKPELGYLRINKSLTLAIHDNGWSKAIADSFQYVQQIYNIDLLRNFIPIDAYTNSGSLTDLEVRVYLNGARLYDNRYVISVVNNTAYINFFEDLKANDVLVVKTKSSAPKIKGHYEFPFNLENNPQNLNLTTFTLGEINNHVSSIADNITTFRGTVPGKESLRDLGVITPYAKKIVQHSAPLLPIVYHITDKDYNVVKALKTARADYAKFKRNLIRVATDYGYDGITKTHLDLVLKEVTKDLTKINPYYLSDMIPCAASFVFDQEVFDDSITEYPLIFNFNLSTSSERAVLVYLNDVQLLHGSQYEFIENNFVKILVPIESGDNLKIAQYEKTDGCHVPPTPTKLGLYPKFEPKIYVDTTYQTPTKVIQGHDGSITVAFNDYRDDLLLEFEQRIFNNIKVNYDPKLFDIYDFVSGYARLTSLSQDDLNSVLVSDFLTWSSLISDDYTKHTFYESTNPKTFNYKKFKALDGTSLQGFWRGIFKNLFDTDRPHTHPWEMLGLSVKPTWWESQYGPAPYTSDNLILWNDLAEGVIREPGKNAVRIDKFVRPHLLTMLPVDPDGQLKSPMQLNVVANFNTINVQGEFDFGDHSPIENAWRRSSEYPFALITALTVLRPAKMFATCFDRVRQFRDDTGQIVYRMQAGNLRFSIQNLAITSTSADNERKFTSGLINYIVDYIIGKQSVAEVAVYKTEINNLQARLASKLGGFTTKEKFKLILDSRSPLNKGNVFVPEENYSIVLNTSSPVDAVAYSGVIIEKQSSGFIIRGYDKTLPYFTYFKPVTANSDSSLNVGGISEAFSEWQENQYYSKDRIVKYDDAYYRVTTAHEGTSIFELKYFVKMPSLPIVGGRNIIIRSSFEESISILHYGSQLLSVQDVVDFLLGYGSYLTSVGFRFENFNGVIKSVTDFQTSAKEFAFWTTQQWSAGALISLSPAAEEVKFSRDYTVIDDIYDKFYDYSILKQDGTPLQSLYTSNIRESNLFTLRPKDTADGIYAVKLNLVQKEHVLIIDNVTIFNDTIYDQIQGYRQDRIKVVGYRTSNWQGDFDIPGFVYDQAEVKFWMPWVDFNLGDTVKYKEFYYAAKTNVPGSQTFDFNQWNKLESRPEPKLIPNWDYRANQFADFYDLDTDSFDPDQQKFAQHLIGYQKRQYLENIINDDVSQYKFYQGMITEKGTENSLSKLFDPLSTSSKDSLEFYEEWAIRIGQYGSNAGFDEVEFLLDENKFLINPQPIELAKFIDPNLVDFVYRILPDEVYLKSNNYTHTPFRTKRLVSNFVSTAGYVNPEDVELQLETKDDIKSVNINSLEDGYYFWISNDKSTWNVYRFTLFENKVKSITATSTAIRITLNRKIDTDIKVGEWVGFNNTTLTLEGFHKVSNVGVDYFDILVPAAFNISLVETLIINLYKFVSVRIKSNESFEQVNSLGIPKKKNGDLIWVDGQSNDWAVWKYEAGYVPTTVTNGQAFFGNKIAVDNKNTVLVTATRNNVYYYTRPTSKSGWAFKDEISPVTTQTALVPNENLLLTNNTFGTAISVSADSTYLVVGAPEANVESLVVGSTSSNGNTLTLSSGTTTNILVGQPVIFAQFPIGGVELGVTYYIESIISLTRFTISETPGGSRFPLETRNGLMSVYANQGYAVLYVQNANGFYSFSNIITAKPVNNKLTNNQFFGQFVDIVGNKIFVAARGSKSVRPSLSAFYISQLTAGRLDIEFISTQALVNDPVIFDVTLGTTIIAMDAAENGNVIVSFSDGTIKVHSFSQLTNFNVETQTIRAADLPAALQVGTKSNFGMSVSVSNNGLSLAVGAPAYTALLPNDPPKPEEGAVIVYENHPLSFSNWEVTSINLSNGSTVVTSSLTNLSISTGTKTLSVRRGGTGLTLNVVSSFGVIKSLTIVNAGLGYEVGDIVVLDGGDQNATYRVLSVNPTTKAVLNGILVTRGTNYFSTDYVTVPQDLFIFEAQQVTIKRNDVANDDINYMIGVVNSYNSVTGELEVNVKEAYTPGVYVAKTKLRNPTGKSSENFGSNVEFNISGDQLAIAAAGGSQLDTTTFDVYTKHLASATNKYVNDPLSSHSGNPTTFDLDATIVAELEFGTGSVAIFDKYETSYIFSDLLSVDDALGVNYGNAIAISDRIYIGDFNSTTGAVYEFASTNKSWYKYRQASQVVDINKIKSVFLYDTTENQIISYLDMIDPLQGKILGIAEQELSFKTYYDPATYSTVTDVEEVVKDPLMFWKAEHVGQLWWDLSSANFLNPNQGGILYKANTWNTIFDDKLVNVYEWVESEYSPTEWDNLADTELGLTLGISGRSKYGIKSYSVTSKYDTVSKTSRPTYYFWVRNKAIAPEQEGRSLSAKDVAQYISNPKDMGISYIAMHDSNQFSLVNCKNLVTGKQVALNVRYWVIDNFDQANIHSHYQLLSNSDISNPINKYIEQKWFDSLSGFDMLGNEVPDPRLPVKLKYGVQSRPRQSMFVNRIEALKQFIERVNRVLLSKSIIDDFDFSNLNSKDEPPALASGKFDYQVSTYSQIRFVGTNDIATATLTPVIERGRIIRVNIVTAGRGYVNAPEVIVNGIGKGAKILTVLGEEGQIISAVVDRAGDGYLNSTTLTVRTLSVLVSTDETASNKWTLYSWNAVKKVWFRETTQTYDTTKYWKYQDWYAQGYNEVTKLDQLVDFIYELPSKNVAIGDVVKVKNQGVGGWVLLEKIDNQDVLETTVNYKTVGRESGTIQFTDNLYKFAANSQGYDGPTFDSIVFDDQPKKELEIILHTIKDSIFVDDLAVEYKELFFASLRYAFSEQKFIDWAFKTSFVRSKHNLGRLTQKPTYQNDNLESYQEYINEVKPYRSKIREFVSNYEVFETTNSQVADFDLPPRYDAVENKVKTFTTRVSGASLSYDSPDIEKYPYSDWLYNAGFNLGYINIVDSGEGYTTAPQVIISGAPSSVTATAYISAGKVTKIIVDDPESVSLFSTPSVDIVGSLRDGGRIARAVAILSNGLVRSTKIGIKFDRVSSATTYPALTAVEKFEGSAVSGSRTRFELRWPIDVVNGKTTVTDNNGEVLSADYTVFNEIDTTYSYTRYKGVLVFDEAPARLSRITIEYNKNIELFDAADRINYFYNPEPGQLGKDLGQLMQGVDYGGVEITGIGFDVGSGWDALPWFTTGYDTFDPDFTDFLIKSDGVTRSFMLNYTPTDIEYINVYWIGNRSTVSAVVTGTAQAGSTSLVVVSAAGITKGQIVTGPGITEQVSVSSISGITVTLTSAFALPVSGTYTFTANESFNRRLDDPNYDAVHPLQVELVSLRAELEVLRQNIVTAQTDRDYYAELETTLTNDAELYNEQWVAAQANPNATPEEIAELLELRDSALEQAVDATLAKEAAEVLIANGNTLLSNKATEISEVQTELGELPVLINVDAVMNSFIGDGESSGPVVIPNTISLQLGDTIILRKNTSDGSFKPADLAYDTQIFGGDFAYVSATGLAPEDINIDGDGFVTPTSSHAPEEVVTGQVVDTVDISVFHKIGDGSPVIETEMYAVESEVTRYKIGQRPGTASAIVVTVNKNIIQQGVNYTVDFNNEEIELLTTYVTGSELVITSLSQNGLDILDLDFFTGDGSTTEFISSARWDSEVTVFVTVNGESANVTVFKTTSSYELVGNIGIRFAEAPIEDAVINYTVLGSVVDSISKVQKQIITHNGITDTYELSTNPEFIKPLSDNVLVVLDGNILRPTDTVYFEVSGNSRTYTVDSSRYAFNSIDSRAISVTVNGISIVQAVDYFWFPVNNQLRIKRGVANSGDKIALSINLNADYIIEETATGTAIKLFNSYNAGTVFTLTTFSNHDILEIERQSSKIVSASTLTSGTQDYYKFNQSAGGRIKLRRPALGSQYVWVTLNKKLLTPDVDYALESNMNYVAFKPATIFYDTDVIEVIAFSNKVTRGSFGYKIFKDMLNKNSYLRIDDSKSTVLLEPLYYYDSKIVLEDASRLPEPSPRLNKPGVIVINGERIEYLRKEDNVLRQLKRGTLGTGVKNLHAVGTLVRDQSVTQHIPYKDEFVTEVTVSDGYNTGSTIYSNSPTVTVSSIVFEGEDQTSDSLGNNLVTIIGTGFKINVRVFVGEVECAVIRVSEEELTFRTPARTVGAYDLIIYNPPISAPSIVTTGNLTGTVAGASAITTVTLSGGLVTTGVLRVGMTLTKVSGVGGFGNDVVITEINSPTQFTVRSTSANVFGAIVFTATEIVRTTVVPGTINTNGLVSTVTLSGDYNTVGLTVGLIVSRVSGTGVFGQGAIITAVNSLTQFEVTATTNNAEGAIVFNINNQAPSSRVVTGAIKYLKIPLNFTPLGTEITGWYRESIPSSYVQCNDVEIFVAGHRMRKSPYSLWHADLGPDSPSGDVQLEAEFSVNGDAVNPHIRLTKVPEAGQYIQIQKRIGRTWAAEGGNLVDSGSDPAKFIRSTYALLPDKNKV
jgi:hypothetical protein